MLNAMTRSYDYYTIGEENEYGQVVMPGADATPAGQVRMAIYITSQSIQDNINYKDASYMGLTFALLDDTYVIQYGDKRLKVLYVNPQGRLNQVFMAEV
jgi:hypothetical protein